MRIQPTYGVMGAVLAGLWWAAAAGVAAQQQPPRVLIGSLAGRDSFERYCVGCHGTSGQGDGPAALAVGTRAADLTTLSRRSGGAFPRERVRDSITGRGRTITEHGTLEMPVWGEIFQAFESDTRVRARIDSLMAYIDTLQRPSTAPEDLGARLFQAHCAVCHGTTARGNGALSEHLRHTPPDLTQLAARNGGMFPSVRVARVIDGRDVPSHGDREMPIWGYAFRAMPGGSNAARVKARIEAIVRYLEGIQERAG